MSTLFPFPSYRTHQKSAFEQALDALDDGKHVVLDLPTGVGKSGVNIGLCRAVDSAYYTTPQRELREQLMEDPVLSDHYKVLRARRDYRCDHSSERCSECDRYTDPDLSCSDVGRDCTYRSEVAEAAVNDITVLTMSRLLIAGQKSWGRYLEPRDLLVVDEAHSLEDQAAGMHASIVFSPETLPEDVFVPVLEGVDPKPDDEVWYAEDLWGKITEINNRLNGFIRHHEDRGTELDAVIGCKRVSGALSHFWREQDRDRDWVVRIDEGPSMELQPVEIDKFLRRFFWSQADQVVLSTATVPYRGDEETWVSSLGLDPQKIEVVSRPSPFPPTNRMVHTRAEIGKMSQEEDEIWDDCVEKIAELAEKHDGQRGLVHTASYDRAERLEDAASRWPALRGDLLADRPDLSLSDWLESDFQIFCSPSLMQGVDLEGDRCRWQVLLKVPYPHPDDPRVQHMLNRDRWYWYNQKAAVSILQSVGRAVRGPDDEADFYVLDSSFEDVRRSVTFPDWFSESIS